MASIVVHVAALAAIVSVMEPTFLTPRTSAASPLVVSIDPEWVALKHLVFIANDSERPAAGGGGGGNRQSGPIRRAQGVGSDAITLRVTPTPPAPEIPVATDVAAPVFGPRWAPVVMDTASLASGVFEQSGLPDRGPIVGTSTGPGSGGGVGTGHGTGIGTGNGPGLGPGAGGGTGGGVYRPGGSVTAPRVLVEVKPVYTDDALRRRVQGTVMLELIVTRDGRPTNIRVARSLDPEGLDRTAVSAAERWRFEPGRLNGSPVDVLVTLLIDFWIW
jgi:TonB family protein